MMPSRCRLSKLKADAMPIRANSVTNSHAWRNMVAMSGRRNRRLTRFASDVWDEVARALSGGCGLLVCVCVCFVCVCVYFGSGGDEKEVERGREGRQTKRR